MQIIRYKNNRIMYELAFTAPGNLLMGTLVLVVAPKKGIRTESAAIVVNGRIMDRNLEASN